MEIGEAVVKKKVRPCIPNMCVTLLFVLCMGGTAILSNSFHWIPRNSFEVIEGSGTARSYVSFAPFWSDVETATFHMTDNRLIIPIHARGNTVRRNCEVTYDINSAQLFAETFGKGHQPILNEFARDVAAILSLNGTVETPAYSVTGVQCNETIDMYRLLTEYQPEMYLNSGLNTMKISIYVHAMMLYSDCTVQYRIKSLSKFADRFMKNVNVIEIVDSIKSSIANSLRTGVNDTLEYNIVSKSCEGSYNLRCRPTVCPHVVPRDVAEVVPTVVETAVETADDASEEESNEEFTEEGEFNVTIAELLKKR